MQITIKELLDNMRLVHARLSKTAGLEMTDKQLHKQRKDTIKVTRELLTNLEDIMEMIK